MKLLRSLLLTVATVFLISASVHAAAPVLLAQEQGVDTITQPNGSRVERGMTQMAARRQLGEPQKVLTPDVWIYYGYRATGAVENLHNCDTLVVAFHKGKVSELKLVTPATATALAASLRSAGPTPAKVARN